MHISAHVEPLLKYGDYKNAIKSLKEAGFSAFDLTINPKPWPLPESFFIRTKTFDEILADTTHNGDWINLDYAKELRKFADEIGIICNQTHAPYPTAWVGDEIYNKRIFNLLVMCLEVTSIIGAEICVIHPCNHYDKYENAEKIYLRLLPYAKKFNVKIALENMWNYDYVKGVALPAACSSSKDFLAHLEILPEECFCACVDLGHAEMRGLSTSACEMLKTLGNKVKTLHIHDNDFVKDLHTLPYLGKIEFEEIFRTLKEIEYNGDVTFEIKGFLNKFPDILYKDALRLMYKVGEFIRYKITGD